MLDEESRDVATFTEGIALYRFKRLPFGLSCSPVIFSRQLMKVLAPVLKENWVKNDLVDVVVYAKDYETLLTRLDKLSSHMREASIKLNLSKCNTGLR